MATPRRHNNHKTNKTPNPIVVRVVEIPRRARRPRDMHSDQIIWLWRVRLLIHFLLLPLMVVVVVFHIIINQ